jgi:hypothetical protein
MGSIGEEPERVDWLVWFLLVSEVLGLITFFALLIWS